MTDGVRGMENKPAFKERPGQDNGDLLEEIMQFLRPSLLPVKILGLYPFAFSSTTAKTRNLLDVNLTSNPTQLLYSLAVVLAGSFGSFALMSIALFENGPKGLDMSMMDYATFGIFLLVMSLLGPQNGKALLQSREEFAEVCEDFRSVGVRQNNRDVHPISCNKEETHTVDYGGLKKMKRTVLFLLIPCTWLPYCVFGSALFVTAFFQHYEAFWFIPGIVLPHYWSQLFFTLGLHWGQYMLLSCNGFTKTRIRKATHCLQDNLGYEGFAERGEHSSKLCWTTSSKLTKVVSALPSPLEAHYVGEIDVTAAINVFQRNYNEIEDDHERLMEILDRPLRVSFFACTCMLIVALYYTGAFYIFGPSISSGEPGSTAGPAYYARLTAMGILVLSNAINLVIMAEEGQTLIDESKAPLKILDSLPTIYGDNMTDQDRMQVGQLIQRLRSHPISTDVSGIFTVRRSLLISIASQVIAYVVVLLQFRQTSG